jgi:hypothetical protein
MSALYEVWLQFPNRAAPDRMADSVDHARAKAIASTLERGHAGSVARVVEQSRKQVKKGVDDGKVEQRKTTREGG